jgi:large subunit ribosomal protein L3
MIQALIGKKIDQKQKFLQNGKRIPVTEIAVLDNAVLQVKTIEKDLYAAAQLGIGVAKKPNKPVAGHVKKSGYAKVPAVIREVSLDKIADGDMPKAGDVIAVESVFKPGDIVNVTGISKGKGFAGVVKRHNFRGGPKTHGQSDRHRAPGAIGQGTTPGRVYRGKRMAGRMGSETVTLQNLTVVAVDSVNKILSVLGLVPGHKNSVLSIKRVGEVKNFVALLTPEEPKEPKKTGENESAIAVASSVVGEEQKDGEQKIEENKVVESKTEEVAEQKGEKENA